MIFLKKVHPPKWAFDLKTNIKFLKTEEISKPIYLNDTIVIIKKTGERVFEKNIEKIKNKIVREEKEKKLQMFSKAHYSKLEKTIQISFL